MFDEINLIEAGLYGKNETQYKEKHYTNAIDWRTIKHKQNFLARMQL